jgi:rod shape determining protein RodA
VTHALGRLRGLSWAAVPWRRLSAFDWPLLAAVLAAVAFGTAMIYSATRRIPVANAWDDLVVKQLVFLTIGLAGMALVASTDYRMLLDLWRWIYGIVIAVLLFVFFAGHTALGAQRWIRTGLFNIQPSEFTKLALVICLVAYFETRDARQGRHVLGSLALVGVPMALVLLEPNLSTTILLGAIWLGIALAAGLRLLHFSLLAILVGPALYVALRLGLLQGYWLERITAWLNPLADPRDTGFQNIQTLIAVGNGGLTGIGFARGMQAQGGWLPLMYTDNIYALVAEELGFVGALGVLFLLGFIIWRVLRAAGAAQDRAGALICVGVGTYILVQMFVNVAVVLQLLPVTGLSLPFISYGGSSLVSLCLAIGLVQSVLVRRRPLEFR